MKKIKGRVWKFGDYIDVDAMGGAGGSSQEPAKKFILTNLRPNFPEEVRPGDVIVAGNNWGAGSAPGGEGRATSLKELGVGAIVADSMGRLFFRTCIALGLPVFSCMGVSRIFNDGDDIEIDIAKGEVKNLTNENIIQCNPMSEHLLHMLEKGGIKALFLEKARKLL
jgi:3-isopropylmalate/(R)-2-methylmalate dehydratase small subunit